MRAGVGVCFQLKFKSERGVCPTINFRGKKCDSKAER